MMNHWLKNTALLRKKKIQLDIYEQKKAKNYNFPFYLALLALSAIITAAVLHGQNISLMRFLQSESKREKKIFLLYAHKVLVIVPLTDS